MKIFIAGFFHETMTFSKEKTTLEHFKNRQFARGDELYQSCKGIKNDIGAFIDTIEKNKFEAIYSLRAGATPSGLVDREVYDIVLKQILDDLKANPTIDGILLHLHGAMVVEGISDPEGQFLKELKLFTKNRIPIMATLDFHANIGPDMITYSDALVGYKTYPHVDMYECGLAVADLMVRTLKKEIKPVMKYRNIPLISPLLAQGTYANPMQKNMSIAKKMESEKDILSVSLFPGFGFADIPENGFTVLVITNNNKELAEQKVSALSEIIWNCRAELKCNPTPVKEAVALAIQSVNKNGPVILTDVADNPGGGGAGDGVAILKELIRQKATSAVISTIWDAESARQMHQKKVGESITLKLGGKSSDHLGTSLEISGIIHSLKDGKFTNKGPFNTGAKQKIGLTGVLNINGILIIIHEFRAQTLDKEIIRFTGIEPESQAIIVIKSTIHYRADFQPIASKIIEVDGPGLVCPNVSALTFEHIRRPAYPFDIGMARPW